MVGEKKGQFTWLTEKDCPKTIGRFGGFMGNAGVLMRAYIYAKMLGNPGMKRVGEFATLNANYLMKHLEALGYTLAFPDRRATHEFIITIKVKKAPFKRKIGRLDEVKAARELDLAFIK